MSNIQSSRRSVTVGICAVLAAGVPVAGSASVGVPVDRFEEADVLTRHVMALLDLPEEAHVDWTGRARTLLTGVTRAMVHLRHEGVEEAVSVPALSEHVSWRGLTGLADGRRHPTLPDDVRSTLRSYLGSLPGYDAGQGTRQRQSTLDHAGYLEGKINHALLSAWEPLPGVAGDPTTYDTF